MLSAWNQLFQCRQHLATVTHPQGESVWTVKESTEVSTQYRVIQNCFCPALTGTKHVAVREAATDNQATEVRQLDSLSQQITHVYIEGSKASAFQCGAHLNMTVDTLLAQNGDLRAHRIRKRSDHILAHIKC